MRTLLGIVLCFLLPVSALSQGPTEEPSNNTPPEPRVLTATSHITLDIPMFGGTGNTRCDASGDLVFDAASLFLDHGPYLKVSADGRRHTIFTIPNQVNIAGSDIWAVSPDGTLYVLRDGSQGNQLVQFKEDGSVAGISSLEIPAHVHVQKIAVADNGTLFLAGYRSTQGELVKPEPGFAALYKSSGKMIHDLSDLSSEVDLLASRLPEGKTMDLTAAAKTIPEGDLIAGGDGRFYVLGSGTVQVFNQSGEETGHFKIAKPSEDSRALRIDYSAGIISVGFYTLHQPRPDLAPIFRPTVVLLNASTGERRGVYAFGPDLTGTVLCYTSQEGYTLMAVDHKMAALDRVEVR